MPEQTSPSLSWLQAEEHKALQLLQVWEERLRPYETSVREQPYHVDRWIDYLDELEATTTNDDNHHQTMMNEHILYDWVCRRALALLPRSYKLWKLHWEHCLRRWNQEEETDSVARAIACLERAVLTLGAYPRVWEVYMEEILERHPHCCSVTVLRRIFNRALQSVAVAQHGKLWPHILRIVYTNTENEGNKDKEETGSTAAASKNEMMTNADATTASSTTRQAWQLPVETRAAILARYVQFYPSFGGAYAEWLVQQGLWGKAAMAYQSNYHANTTTPSGNSAPASSTTTNTTATTLQAFLQLVTQHPQAVAAAGVPWEAMLRALLPEPKANNKTITSNPPREKQQDASSSSQSSILPPGLVWTSLADAWVRQGLFDQARSVYTEALDQVATVKDFNIVYQAYLTLEEGLLEAAVEALEENGDDDGDAEMGDGEAAEGKKSGDDDDDDDWDILLSANQSTEKKTAAPADSNNSNNNSTSLLAGMELAVARAEHLTARRPLMLNAVLLRQEPGHVGEWLERAKLLADERRAARATLHEALETVRPAHRAVHGTPDQLVTALATLYEEEVAADSGDNDKKKALEPVNKYLRGICLEQSYPFSKAEQLARCWTFWIELQLRHEQWDQALDLARQSIHSGKKVSLKKSLALWDLLLDLEESLGTVQTTKDAYNQALETKVATVQHVLNFATFLTDQKYFEEAFTAYERGVEMFAFPHHPGAKLLWKAYLEAFDQRYSGTKVERSRDLFERCLEYCPPEESTPFFLMNGKFEESHGLTKRALDVYRRMTSKVPEKAKLQAYQLYIAKTTKYLGVTATRDIYQEALEHLPELDAAKLCLEFARTEARLQQIDRARGIYAYGAPMANPYKLPEFYQQWNDFEVSHGNEETFREMLRIKRSVEAAFQATNYNASGMAEQVPNLSNEEAMEMIANREGDDLDTTGGEGAATNVSGFVKSSRGDNPAAGTKRSAAAASLDEVEARVAKLRKATGVAAAAAEEEAQNINDDDGDDEIDIDDIDAEIEEAAAEGEATVAEAKDAKDDMGVSTKAIPQAVFGSLVK